MKTSSRFVLVLGAFVLMACASLLACRDHGAGANAGALMNMNQMTFAGTMSGDAQVPANMTYAWSRCTTSADGGTCSMTLPIPPLSGGEVDIAIASQQADGGLTSGSARFQCGVVSHSLDAGAACKTTRACTASLAYITNDAGVDAGWTEVVTIIPDAGCVASVVVGENKLMRAVNWKASEQFVGIP